MASRLHPRIVRAVLAALFCLSLRYPVQAQDIKRFHFDEKPGGYKVGLRVVPQYDYSRTFRSGVDAMGMATTEERARPLQTLIWYPATDNKTRSMSVQDYIDLLPAETDFNETKMPARWQDLVTGMQSTSSALMWAVRDAAPAKGKYPVIIYAPSYNSMSWENADLCEYLASHGYVVIATPDLGLKSRNMTIDQEGIGAGVGDLEFLISFARTLKDTDASKIVVAGYSWGGMANLFTAARDNRIVAMVEMDSSLRYFPRLVKDAGYVHPEQMTIPMLYFSPGEASIEKLALYPLDYMVQAATAPNVLNEWTHGDLITVNMRGLVHTEFSSMFQRNESYWEGGYERNHIADYTREDGSVGYAWVARYVLAFVDFYVKGDRSGSTFLSADPSENGAPAHFISVTYRRANGLPPTMDSLRVVAGKQGFEHIAASYESMKDVAPEFKPGPTEMSGWADELNAGGHSAEAIEVLKLNLQINPDDYGSYVALGNAYLKAGERQKAIEMYSLALKRNPIDGAARDKLKQLTK